MPFTLFCHLSSADEALRFLRESGASIDGTAHDWSATLSTKTGIFGKKRAITFTYEREWCSPPNWPAQLAGMANFVAHNFEMSDSTRRILLASVLPRLRYSIGIITEPEVTTSDDPRLAIIRALAAQLGAIVFTPEGLLDPELRALASASGELDDAATIPTRAGDGTTFDVSPEPAGHDHQPAAIPPSASRVAHRMYTLLAVVARALFDMNTRAGRQPAYALSTLVGWAEALVDDELEHDERAMLRTPAGELSQRQTIDGVWAVEGAAVLAWALGLSSLPAYDTPVAVDDLFRATGLLDLEQSRRRIGEASLRSMDELRTFGEQALAYHWRMVDLRVNPKAIPFDRVSIFGGPFDLSWARLSDGDLLLRDQPVSRAEPSLQRLCASISTERLRAANWLRGDARLYSETPTDT